VQSQHNPTSHILSIALSYRYFETAAAQAITISGQSEVFSKNAPVR
jgi:hypothetical protein